jgi:hypothetical protein
MQRLVSRAPELGRVIRDLDDLLEDTRDIEAKLVAQLFEVSQLDESIGATYLTT